jgi:hypothetical protein
MKNKLSFVFLLALAMSISWSSFAQEGSFSMHLGASLPLSDFGDDDISDDDSGGAGVGLNLGGKYVYTLNQSGLGLFVGADFMYNGLKSGYKDDFENALGLSSSADIKFYKYVNVPIMAGLNYTVKANDQISLFADFGIGASILKMTEMKVEENNNEVLLNWKLSTVLGYNFGGGVLINDKYSIGLNYYGLGEHKLKGEVEANGQTQDMDDIKLKVNILTLTAGIKF